MRRALTVAQGPGTGGGGPVGAARVADRGGDDPDAAAEGDGQDGVRAEAERDRARGHGGRVPGGALVLERRSGGLRVSARARARPAIAR